MYLLGYFPTSMKHYAAVRVKSGRRTPLLVMRSNQGYYTRSHQNSEVKRLWAGIVLGWVTSREVPVLHPLLVPALPPAFLFFIFSFTIPGSPVRQRQEPPAQGKGSVGKASRLPTRPGKPSTPGRVGSPAATPDSPP